MVAPGKRLTTSIWTKYRINLFFKIFPAVFPLRPYGAQLAQRVRELAQSFLKGKNKKEVFLLRTWDGISNSEILSNHHALKVDHHNQTKIKGCCTKNPINFNPTWVFVNPTKIRFSLCTQQWFCKGWSSRVVIGKLLNSRCVMGRCNSSLHITSRNLHTKLTLCDPYH